MSILKILQQAHQQGEKRIAVLIDPDKIDVREVKKICARVENASVDLILIGGSTVSVRQTEVIAKETKRHSKLSVILFPGDYTHLTHEADALLFLNLISGDNPEYLIHQQVKSIPFLEKSTLEIIPTGYLLIDGGIETSTMRVTNTQPIAQRELGFIKNIAKAGALMGQQLIYLEAGSGAKFPVGKEIVKAVSSSVNIPIIVGGGIKTHQEIQQAHQNGATLVMIGTAFEKKMLYI